MNRRLWVAAEARKGGGRQVEEDSGSGGAYNSEGSTTGTDGFGVLRGGLSSELRWMGNGAGVGVYPSSLLRDTLSSRIVGRGSTSSGTRWCKEHKDLDRFGP